MEQQQKPVVSDEQLEPIMWQIIEDKYGPICGETRTMIPPPTSPVCDEVMDALRGNQSLDGYRLPNKDEIAVLYINVAHDVGYVLESAVEHV
jgi:hypothetical protein